MFNRFAKSSVQNKINKEHVTLMYDKILKLYISALEILARTCFKKKR